MDRILNTEDIIYRRDVIDRVRYLERLKRHGGLIWNLDEELESLRGIIVSAGGYKVFEDGEPLISERFFAEYGKNKSDYLRIDFAGITYFMYV